MLQGAKFLGWQGKAICEEIINERNSECERRAFIVLLNPDAKKLNTALDAKKTCVNALSDKNV